LCGENIKDSMEDHFLRQHFDDLFQCCICGTFFTSAQMLGAHIRGTCVVSPNAPNNKFGMVALKQTHERLRDYHSSLVDYLVQKINENNFYCIFYLVWPRYLSVNPLIFLQVAEFRGCCKKLSHET
jgi:hypothetical protein